MAWAVRVRAETERRPHEAAQIYYIGVDSSPIEIDLFVDIEDQIENRIKAETMFASQGHIQAKSRRKEALVTGFTASMPVLRTPSPSFARTRN